MVSVFGGEGNLLKDFTRTSASASPGFAFGDLGNKKNAYLLFNSVPSDNTGALMFLNNAALLGFSIATSDVGTYEVEIYEHDTITYTLLDSLTITSDNQGAKVEPTPITLTTGLRLAVKISNLGQAKNPNVQLIIRGDLPV